MTAAQVIRQFEQLPSNERSKVFAYIDAELERREAEADQQALFDAEADSRPDVAWDDVKMKHGLR